MAIKKNIENQIIPAMNYLFSWWSVTHMFPGFLTPVLTQLFFPKPLTPFSRASEVRGENTPE